MLARSVPAAFACARRSKNAIRLPLRKSISCAIPRWNRTCGSNCTSRLPAPGWRHSRRHGPIPRPTDRGLATHDGLQDFLDVYDELNENIDTYVDRKSDLRKVLKIVIDGDTEFQAKLRALRDDATAKKEEMEQYEFLLTNALETLDSSVQDHRQLLTEQEEAAKHKKKPAKP